MKYRFILNTVSWDDNCRESFTFTLVLTSESWQLFLLTWFYWSWIFFEASFYASPFNNFRNLEVIFPFISRKWFHSMFTWWNYLYIIRVFPKWGAFETVAHCFPLIKIIFRVPNLEILKHPKKGFYRSKALPKRFQ